MKWYKLVFLSSGIFLSLMHVIVSMNNCIQDISSTLRSLSRQSDVICLAAVKEAPSYTGRTLGFVDKFFGNRPPVAEDSYNITIKIRNVLKGSKRFNAEPGALLTVKIPKGDTINNCVQQIKTGEKFLFFLRMDDLHLKMFTPPVRPSKKISRKLRRHLHRTNFIKILKKKNRKVAEGKKLKLTCTSTQRNAKFRWLRNGRIIRKSPEMSFKKKNQGKANPKSVLRIRKLRQDHTGLYTCNIDVGGKKYSRDFNITVIGPSEVQCADQKYCFNQGECWQKLPPLDEKYCKCDMNYSGLRCESVSINSSLLRNLQSVTGRSKHLTQAVIAIGAVLAVLVLGIIVALPFFVCHQIKNRRQRKENEHTMSFHDSFIHPGIQGETYCHIPSDDVPNSDSLVLSSWVKPTDECLVNNLQESIYSESQLGSCNGRRYIPALHTTYVQFSPTDTANSTATQYIIQPSRSRLPAVSTSAQCIDEITVNRLGHALSTQVIYAEPNRAHSRQPSNGSNNSLIEDSTCDRPIALSPYQRVPEINQSNPHLYVAKPCSVVCSPSSQTHPSQTSNDGEENPDAKDLLLASLHISEEDLIMDNDDIKPTVGPIPQNYPNVLNPECHGTRYDESGGCNSSLQETGGITSPSCADGTESLGSAAEDMSTSELIPSTYNRPLGDLDSSVLNSSSVNNNSVLNFVF